jgi:hypothetical protein
MLSVISTVVFIEVMPMNKATEDSDKKRRTHIQNVHTELRTMREPCVKRGWGY